MRTGGSGWLARLTRHDATAVAETITSRSRGALTRRIGMIVDMIYRAPDWMDEGIGPVSTSDVEKLLPMAPS
jgi:hypothetical protein